MSVTSPESGASSPALLSVRDLTVEFRTENGVVTAVDGVSFDLRAGEILALVGESGCGKSATALALLRLISDPPGRIAGGEVRFRDRDLLQADDAGIREVRGNRIAMIFQEPMTSLNPVYTIGRQLGENSSCTRTSAARPCWRSASRCWKASTFRSQGNGWKVTRTSSAVACGSG